MVIHELIMYLFGNFLFKIFCIFLKDYFVQYKISYFPFQINQHGSEAPLEKALNRACAQADNKNVRFIFFILSLHRLKPVVYDFEKIYLNMLLKVKISMSHEPIHSISYYSFSCYDHGFFCSFI